MTYHNRLLVSFLPLFIAAEIAGEAFLYASWNPFDTCLHFAWGAWICSFLLWNHRWNWTRDGTVMWTEWLRTVACLAAWEVFEHSVDFVHGSPLMVKGGWADTSMDMIAGMIGAVVACGIWLLFSRIEPNYKFEVIPAKRTPDEIVRARDLELLLNKGLRGWQQGAIDLIERWVPNIRDARPEDGQKKHAKQLDVLKSRNFKRINNPKSKK